MMNTEWQNFQESEHVAPPEHVSRRVISRIQSRLKPSAINTASRVLLAHGLSVTVTLAYCPQFGLGWTSNPGVTTFFMNFGHTACTFLCGALLLGTTGVFSALLLRPEQWRAFWRAVPLSAAALGLLTLLGLSLAGAQPDRSLSLVWGAGALFAFVAASFTTSGVQALRRGWGFLSA